MNVLFNERLNNVIAACLEEMLLELKKMKFEMKVWEARLNRMLLYTEAYQLRKLRRHEEVFL